MTTGDRPHDKSNQVSKEFVFEMTRIVHLDQITLAAFSNLTTTSSRSCLRINLALLTLIVPDQRSVVT